MKLTIGSDPELMLFDNKLNRVVSAVPVLKCDKHNPIDLGQGFKMYADNALVEFSMPPANNPGEFTALISQGMDLVKKKLSHQYTILPQASHIFLEGELKSPQEWEVGCNPNFDAYERTMNLPADLRSGQRTGSFHIHIGHPSLRTVETREKAVRLMDIYVGCASVIFDKDSTAHARRALYGKAGEFRPTPYGIEYRVLGPWPLRHLRAVRLVADLTEYAIGRMDRPFYDTGEKGCVRKAINENDRTLAKIALDAYGLPMDLLERVNATY